MPIKRAAYKAIRSDKKKRLRNITNISSIRTLSKKLLSLLPSKNKENIDKALKALLSQLDKAAQKGVIHRKTASRKASRMSKKAAQAIK